MQPPERDRAQAAQRPGVAAGECHSDRTRPLLPRTRGRVGLDGTGDQDSCFGIADSESGSASIRPGWATNTCPCQTERALLLTCSRDLWGDTAMWSVIAPGRDPSTIAVPGAGELEIAAELAAYSPETYARTKRDLRAETLNTLRTAAAQDPFADGGGWLEDAAYRERARSALGVGSDAREVSDPG